MTEARYVELPGEIVLRQPIALTGATMYSWLIAADYKKLLALCDAAFNRPSGGAVEYRPLLSAVTLVCASLERGQSMNPIDREKGWMSEMDLGFWVPLARGKTVNGTFEAEALVWYHPYLFIDNESALLVGRETYGFRKYSATIQFPSAPTDRSEFAVETLVIETFGPDQQGQIAQLWKATAEGPRGELEASFTSLRHVIEETLPHWRSKFVEGENEHVTWELAANLVRDLAEGIVPMVFLRQFRDVANPELAALQEINEAPCKMQRFHRAGIARPHHLSILHADSHPIVEQLGLPGPEIDLGYGVWIQMDFTMENGVTRWRAG